MPDAQRVSREPWIKVKVGLISSDKVGALSSDAARWGWTKTLCMGKTQRRMGVFASTRHLADLLGKHGRFVSEYVSHGLLHVVPDLCARCRSNHLEERPGEVVIHDYRREQRDPTNADRQADFKEAHNAIGNGETNAPVTPEVTPLSRARGMTVTVTETETAPVSLSRATPSPKPPQARGGSPSTEPRLTKEQLTAWGSFSAREWQPFREAWMGRGLLWPPFGGPDDDDTSQRGLLWQIANARPNDLGRWVRQAKGRTSREVITHVLEKWHEVRAEANVDDDEWEERKLEERQAARGRMSRLGEVISDWKPIVEDPAA
jgi:hypothetical protein